MRAWIAVISTAALLAACSNADKAETAEGGAAAPAAAPDAATPPSPRAGLWEQTMTNPVTGSVTLKLCVGEPEPGENAFSGPTAEGADCTQNVTPAIGGAAFNSTCNANGMTIVSNGKVTGDMASAYKVDVTTRTTGANVPPQMAEMKMTIDAKRLGDCPAGVEPGQLVQ
jgi:hypothetical protein